LVGLNALMGNVQPLILGALADGYHLGVRDLGHISSAYVGTNTVAMLLGPLWIRRWNWRRVTLVSALIAAVLASSGALAQTATSVLLVFGLLGIAHAFLGAPSFACLGDATDSDRSYAVSVISQSFVAAVIAAPLSAYVVPTFGAKGLFLFLGLLFLSAAPACIWLPAGGRAPGEPETGPVARITALALAPALAATLALALFMAGALAFWYFDERLGAHRGVTGAVVGATVSGISILSIPAAGVVAWLSKKISSLAFVSLGTCIIIAGYLTLRVPGVGAYVIGNLGFAIGWAVATPGYYAVLRRADPTGRLFVAAPAVGGGAGVVTGLVAGPIIEWGGYASLIAFSGGLTIAAALTLYICALITRTSRPFAGVVLPQAEQERV
jgi:predicted MFS family arabinose efflux permease